MASVQRRGPSRWTARWYEPDGRQRAKSFTRKRDAEAFLATVQTDMLRGRYVDPDAGKVRLQAYAQEWVDRQGFGASTREAVQSRFNAHVYPVLGSLPIGSIRPSTIQAWLSKLTRKGTTTKLAPRTVRVIFANLSSVLSAAVDDQLIAANPCSASSVKVPAPPPKALAVWERKVVDSVVAALPELYTAIGMIAAESGLRQGEVLGLGREHVDFLRKVIHVRRQLKQVGGKLVLAPPKYGRERDVPLTDRASRVLAAHMAAHPPLAVTLPWLDPAGEERSTELLFSTREHNPVNRNTFNAVTWKPALVTAGLAPTRDNGMHALRHAFASALLESGVSIKKVSAYLGHADAGFTLRTYIHLIPEDGEKARQAIERALAAGTDQGQREAEPSSGP